MLQTRTLLTSIICHRMSMKTFKTHHQKFSNSHFNSSKCFKTLSKIISTSLRTTSNKITTIWITSFKIYLKTSWCPRIRSRFYKIESKALELRHKLLLHRFSIISINIRVSPRVKYRISMLLAICKIINNHIKLIKLDEWEEAIKIWFLNTMILILSFKILNCSSLLWVRTLPLLHKIGKM